MGLILAILALLVTLVGSYFCLVAEASNDIAGKHAPKVTISVFVFGILISAALAFTHFHPIGW